MVRLMFELTFNSNHLKKIVWTLDEPIDTAKLIISKFITLFLATLSPGLNDSNCVGGTLNSSTEIEYGSSETSGVFINLSGCIYF